MVVREDPPGQRLRVLEVAQAGLLGVGEVPAPRVAGANRLALLRRGHALRAEDVVAAVVHSPLQAPWFFFKAFLGKKATETIFLHKLRL